MRFTATADTDIGISKDTNQDSVLIKHAAYDGGEVLLAVICDGMGGLAKGELASATVVRAFSDWFEWELPDELADLSMEVIGTRWALLLKELNTRILAYSTSLGLQGVGTTFSGMLCVKNQYLIGHVGDTRVYRLGTEPRQLTTDHTFIARELSRGTITSQQARKDKRRNLLLQCIGASKIVEPQLLCGRLEPGAYLLCSDGFRHELTEHEISASLDLRRLTGRDAMHGRARHLIELAKRRKERDNISVVIIKAE